jgi:tetratricopeptide (TPR) repeat protein
MMESPLSAIPGPDVMGTGVLRELPPDIGLHAWSVLRWVVMWGDEGAGSTEGLFDPAGMQEAFVDAAGKRLSHAPADDPRNPLVAIIGELMQPEPSNEVVARSCLVMAEWALPRQYLVTGLAFAEAAAFAMPSARYAFLAAKLHRQYGRHRDADRLLKVAEGLARKEKDWETNIRIRLARGNVDLLHGRYEQARTAMSGALRTCERYRLEGTIRGEVHHDLLVAESGLRDYETAQQHAEAAIGAYGPDHPRLAHLAHDLAALWMEMGDYENALTVLRSLLERHFQHDVVLRLIACASAVRAAGGCGDADAYVPLTEALDAALGKAPQVTVRHAPALVDAARGAAMAGDRARRDRWVALAARFAQEMQQMEVAADAEAVAKTPSKPATARSRIRRNQELASKTVAALTGIPIR